MAMKKPIISIVIVNYNVKDFLEQALISIRRALSDIPSEIIVVDNNSVDGSVTMLRERFQDVQLIASEKNLGFSGANNLALEKVTGEFIVLINPDTVVQEDTFKTLLEFFKNHPDASAATCKILNPDGSFSVDCRHSIPTPSTAFWKLLGLNRLFPKSRIFGRYNLTYLDENETAEVPAISGSFMMLRKEVVDKVGKLDDRFFMYCEDIDYCHRIQLAGGKIYYVPDTQLIHYKGESSKANNLDYVITFNRSLYLFYKKYYQQKYVYPFKWLILLGVVFRGIVIYLKKSLSRYYPFIWDLLILNTVMFLSFWYRYSLKHSFRLDDFFGEYIVINIITSITYLVSALFFEIARKERFSPEKVFRVLIATFTFVAALVFFFKQFAFSRFVVLMSAIGSSILMIGWRVLTARYARRYKTALGRDFLRKKVLIVGEDKETLNLLDKLHQRMEAGLDIVGVAGLSRKSIGRAAGEYQVLTSLDQLEEFVRIRRISMIIFSTHNIAYKDILETMSRLSDLPVEFKMVPGHLEFMIGKSNIERLDAVPLVDIEYAYQKPFNLFTKRVFDIGLAFVMLLLLAPFALALPFAAKKIGSKKVRVGTGRYRVHHVSGRAGLTFYVRLWDILRGQLSFVGAPLDIFQGESGALDYKPGLTGLLQVNADRLINPQSRENYELHYLKNHSLFMDIEILLKSLMQ